MIRNVASLTIQVSCLMGVTAVAGPEVRLPVVDYQELCEGSVATKTALGKAMHEVGAVGIRGIEGYKQAVDQYVQAWMAFHTLDESVRLSYRPDREKGQNEGYEPGEEKFRDAQGQWQVDKLKLSFYGRYPSHAENRWPTEVDLEGPVVALGHKMNSTAKSVYDLLGLAESGIPSSNLEGYLRCLKYLSQVGDSSTNPYLCSPHCDHGTMTALVPARYYAAGKRVPAPKTGGLVLQPTGSDVWHRVVIPGDSDDVLLIQVGDFGQLASDDTIMATRHAVAKCTDSAAERYTMALFFSPNAECPARPQTSKLRADPRYAQTVKDGGVTWYDWHVATLQDHYDAQGSTQDQQALTE